MRAKKREKQTQLRKQPKLRRVQSTGSAVLPRLAISQTAKRRRRRQQSDKMHAILTTARAVLLSSRWLSLGLLLLSLFAIAQISASDQFYLTRIPVDGVATIPVSEIVAASGLSGKHVFAADPGEAAVAITQVPGIISSTVTLAWPNQVTIRIVEESPVAVWVQDDVSYWVSKSGHIFPSRSAELRSLLVIESEMPALPAPVLTAVDVDEAVAPEEEMTEQMATLPLPFVPEDVLEGAMVLRQLRPNIDRLYYRPSGGLSYQDGRGWRAYFGTGDDMAQKLVVYEELVEDLLARGLTPTYVSVSNQEKPYYAAQN